MASLPIKDDPQFSRTMDGVTTDTWAGPQEFNPRYQVLLDNDNHLKAETEKIKRVKIAFLPASGWSAEAPYTQITPVEGITEEDTPYVSPFIPAEATAEEEKAIKKAAGCVSYVDTGNGTITVTCLGKKPVTDFQVQIKGV